MPRKIPSMTSPTEPLWKFSDESLPGWKGLVVIALCSLLLLYIAPMVGGILGGAGLAVGPEVIFIGMALVVLAIFIVWHNERLWVFSVVFGHALVLIGHRSSSGIGVAESLFAVFVLGGMAIWF